MKKSISLLVFLYTSCILTAQSIANDIFDLIAESDYIILGDVIHIDTLKPEVHPYYQLECNSAEIQVEKVFKGTIAEKTIPLFYYTSRFEHIPSVNPYIHKRYLLFLTYDEARQAYVLPSMGQSMAEVSASNNEIVTALITKLIAHDIRNRCDYFDLLLTNLEEPIDPVNNDLELLTIRHTAGCTDSLDVWYCIDSLDKTYIFNTFRKTRNRKLIPYICISHASEVTILISDEIRQQLASISKSADPEFFDAGFGILTWLKELAYLKSIWSKEITELYDLIIWAERERFIESVEEILHHLLTLEKR